MTEKPQSLAKVTWQDPETGELREYILEEGATATIGRSPNNHIAIPERHVSRAHAVISFRDGVFTISDLGSANGTFVNDKRLVDPFPLVHGDVIRLYVPVLQFSSIVTQEEHDHAKITGTLIVPARADGQPTLYITSGPQEGAEIPLLTPLIRIGRATRSANWDISLQIAPSRARTPSWPARRTGRGRSPTWAAPTARWSTGCRSPPTSRSPYKTAR